MKTKRVKVAYSEPDDYFPRETREKYRLGEFAMTPEEEKTRAAMIGHAVGDALGVPVEFCQRDDLDAHPVTDMMGYGSYDMPAGAWSDDTSMTLATLDSLAKGKVNYEEIMSNFILWFTKDAYTPTGEMFDIGRTCMDAILYCLESVKPALECGQAGERSNGNGSLMRIHPFLLYAHAKRLPTEAWMELVRCGSILTHAHDRAVLGCQIYACVLMQLLDDPCKEAVQRGLADAEQLLGDRAEFSHYKRIFTPDFTALDRAEIRSSGYVVDTLEAALWCLLTTEDYKSCVLKAVNLGRDTDTVAAVAGGLAGALYGYDNIPEAWRDTLIKREEIEEMCKTACEHWTSN